MASLVDNTDGNKHTRILRLPEVMDRTGDSRSTIYRLDKKGILLRAKQLDGSSSVGWHEDSVDALVELRRADPISASQIVLTTRAKALQVPALTHHDRDAQGAKNPLRIPAGRSTSKSARIRERSTELQATSIMIMGNKVYFHAPTGKLFMEVGKAPAFLTGVGVTVDEQTMEDADHPGAASELATRERHAASL
jgi:predicted DNA-binding transcriptional regulator AlpA